MEAIPETSKHDSIKSEIFSICTTLGFNTTKEFKGKGWRADVFASKIQKNVAFEIQTSVQSLRKTLERQEKYIGNGIIGCWLFEKPPSKLSNERPDLPLFYVLENTKNSFSVSLSGRKLLPLHDFLEQFLTGNIKFCENARTKEDQKAKLVFYEMKCWCCDAINHIYYAEVDFRSACNAEIYEIETMWGSDHIEHRPEIIALAKEFIKSDPGKFIKMGEIKKRFSQTVQDSYMSFGCYNCDSLFGDWYVMDAKMEAIYGYGQVMTVERDFKLKEFIELQVPHWCHPGNSSFCDAKWALA